jgi:Tat protein translocase TatB subunit
MLLFFTFGSGEIFLIIIVLVIVLGPKRIPEVARNLGKVINEMKSASSDFKNEINKEVQRLERETRYNEFLKEKQQDKPQTPDITDPRNDATNGHKEQNHE